MNGIQSYHDNGREDRRFKIRCCRAPNKKTHECFITAYLNNWDRFFDYSAPSGYVFAGTVSVHDNGKE